MSLGSLALLWPLLTLMSWLKGGWAAWIYIWDNHFILLIVTLFLAASFINLVRDTLALMTQSPPGLSMNSTNNQPTIDDDGVMDEHHEAVGPTSGVVKATHDSRPDPTAPIGNHGHSY